MNFELLDVLWLPPQLLFELRNPLSGVVAVGGRCRCPARDECAGARVAMAGLGAFSEAVWRVGC